MLLRLPATLVKQRYAVLCSIDLPFEQLDADRDGKVTREELKAYYHKNGCAPVQVQTLYSPSLVGNTVSMDVNSDALFNLLDLNKDGQISLYEWQKGGRDIEEVKRYLAARIP